MEKINNGIVFSEDIERILRGVNAFNYKYDSLSCWSIISDVRSDFRKSTSKIFNGNVVIISEEEMMEVNNLIGGEYPHCIFR